MPGSVVIRRACKEDVPDITQIYNYAILNTTATFDIEPKTLEDRLLWFESHNEKTPIVVAAMDDKVVGWGDIRPFGERAAYRYTLENAVYVDCDYQGMGIGTLLLESLVDIAKSNGYHSILALIVGGNDASVHIHEKQGFEHAGFLHEVGRKFDKWLDLHILEKILS